MWSNRKEIRQTFSSPRQRRLSSYSACRNYRDFDKPGGTIRNLLEVNAVSLTWIVAQYKNTHHDVNVWYTHLPSFGHSLCFFAVDVSLYAGLSSGDENCVPKSQSSQSHSHCAKRTKHTWLNSLPIWQKQSPPSILTHTYVAYTPHWVLSCLTNQHILQ